MEPVFLYIIYIICFFIVDVVFQKKIFISLILKWNEQETNKWDSNFKLMSGLTIKNIIINLKKVMEFWRPTWPWLIYKLKCSSTVAVAVNDLSELKKSPLSHN